ncbi:MAG: hypothetical protein ACKVUS_18985 [Saprospiraceae bacterium]
MKKGAYIVLIALAASAALYAGSLWRNPASECCSSTQCDPDSCDEPCEVGCCQ